MATRVGGVGEVVEDGVSGLLAPPDDRGAFADRLRSLLLDTRRAAAMGQQARQRAVEHFDRQRVAALYEGLYTRLIVGERKPGAGTPTT